ncbi:cytochrome c oxidase assembly factor 5 [Hordeum vulgare]|nr:cytochrome c oxidase assembly factor 5 [Hordeum vulgare]
MSKSCKGLAMELVKCLSETDCVKVQKRPYKECAGEKAPNITSECVGLRETYFNCKRGQACLLHSLAVNRPHQLRSIFRCASAIMILLAIVVLLGC